MTFVKTKNQRKTEIVAYRMEDQTLIGSLGLGVPTTWAKAVEIIDFFGTYL